MRDNVPASFGSANRVVSARLKVYPERPQFTEIRLIGELDIAEHTALSISGVVRRFVFKAWEMGTFYTAEYTPTDTLTEIALNYTAFNLPDATAPASEDFRSVSSAGNVLFIAQNGKIYRKTWDGQEGGWSQVIDFTYDTYWGRVTPMISLVALSETELIAAVVQSGEHVIDRCQINYLVFDPTWGWRCHPWSGMLPRSTAKAHIAAHRTGDRIFVYVDDHSGKKPHILQRLVTGDILENYWSAAAPILPLDALDDESAFSVSHASGFQGKTFLTGILKRRYGPAYPIYMLGPDHFTFGRDLILPTAVEQRVKVLDMDGDFVWIDGPGTCYRSPVAGPFGKTAAPEELDIIDFNTDCVLNGADKLRANLPVRYAREHPDLLAPGANVELEISGNGTDYQLGSFGIDAVRKVEGEEGDSFSVDCSSAAVKRLIDWQSDTYFDYRAQAEVHGDPGDLTKLVRVSGQWATEGGLSLESLNEDGFLYTTPPASNGGAIRAKFINIPNDNAILGVGLNYGEETLAQTAERLGIKLEEVKNEQRGRWGIFATFEPRSPSTDDSDYPVIRLLSFNTIRRGPPQDVPGEWPPGDYPNPWVEIGKTTLQNDYTPGVDTQIVLKLTFQDGWASVEYKLNDSAGSFNSAISMEAAAPLEVHNVNSDHYGRGALFFRNDTGYYQSYPFSSDSDVVPLYTAAETVQNFGIDIRNSTNKFGNTGKILVDSEMIEYSGKVYDDYNKATSDLEWLPGKVILQTTSDFNPGGAEVKFAETRANNYVVLEFDTNLPAGSFLSAVRFWVKKNNFPEDGLEVSIFDGTALKHSNTAQPLGSGPLASGSISADKISASGGMVTCYFSRYVEVKPGQRYRMVIWRARNHTHPDSTNYYSFKLVPAAAGVETYIFAEQEPDSQTLQSGEMPFQIFARTEPPGKEYALVVKYAADANLPTAAASSYTTPPNSYTTYYDGCAAVISDGTGKGNCWRIVRCSRITDTLNDLFVFYLDRDAGRGFGADTRVRVTGAFFGLKRGQIGPDGINKTLAAAHGDKNKVHHFPAGWATSGKSPYFEYFTIDEDLAVAEVGEQIARKAGVEEVIIANAFIDRYTGGAEAFFTAKSKNLLAIFRNVNLMDQPLLTFYGSASQILFQIRLGRPVSLLKNVFGTLTVFEQSSADSLNEFRISLFDGHLSIWSGGKLLLSTVLADPPSYLLDWTTFGVRVPVVGWNGSFDILIPEAGTRVESFVMDMGKSGNQLMQSLIGEKRIFYRDNRFGQLRIFANRPLVAGNYLRSTSLSAEHTDIGLATRLLLEGGEVVEVSDIGKLSRYGNLFKSANFSEINNLEDAQYFAGITLEEMGLNLQRRSIQGAADPAIEPGDQITLRRKGGVDETVVVDSVSHAMQVNEVDAVYDMQISGRCAG